MSKFSSEDRIANERANWKLREKALETARQRLAADGYLYPVWDKDISYLEFYAKIRAYSELETKYVLEAIREEKNKPLKTVEYKNDYCPYKDEY